MTVWHSQAGQDEWVVRMTRGQVGGYFANVGAYDGLESDNTATLEADYGWLGVCVEANPEYADRCRTNRPNAIVVNAAVTDRVGTMGFLHQWEADPGAPGAALVRTATLLSILDEAGAPRIIDYLSVDIEGFEYKALSVFDFHAYHVRFLTVEHNLYTGGAVLKDQLNWLLTRNGMVRVVEDAAPSTGPYAGAPFEDWYCHHLEYPKIKDLL